MRKLKVKNELIEGLLAYSRDMHPKEMILLLRGKVGEDVEVEEVIIPPSAVHGQCFSSFQPYMIPFDLSILGIVHSHPSGMLEPSAYDLNHFYGRIMMIVAYPYQSVEDVAIFDRKGQEVSFIVS
jgi:proteasome lid subunit RPN8/RPN11